MSLRIRPFEDADYAAWLQVTARVFPDQAPSEAELRHYDRHRDPRCLLERYLAVEDAGVVGIAEVCQSSSSYHPRKFHVEFLVVPEAQGRGIGRALWELLLERLAPRDPLSINAVTQETMERGVRFLRERGFGETMREWESRLDPRAADLSALPAAEARLHSQGIEIRSLADLRATDPECNHKLYEALWEIEEDVPRTEPEFTPPPFDQWLDRHLANPNLLPEGQFIAVHEGRYVGLSQLSRMQTSPDLDTGLTGVRAPYRRRGIALALKLRAVAYAREVGAPAIRTWNATHNRGMLSINERLGFVKQPAWIFFQKQLAADPPPTSGPGS